MSAAHTAGQWEVVPLNQHGPYAIRMAYNAEQKFYGVRQIHHEADAKLIAAAPDLLSAMLEILGPLNVCSDNHHVRDDEVLPLDMTMGELRQARAAIAKALGRTPNEIGEEG